MLKTGPFLFVSHVREDQLPAMEIVAELERRGVPCWVAPRDVRPGKPFDDEIAEAIENCQAMLLIFSDNCNKNEYIRREVTVAGEAGKDIIPFRIEDVQPRKALRMRLSDLNWIDAFPSRERAIDEVAKLFLPAKKEPPPEPATVSKDHPPSGISAELTVKQESLTAVLTETKRKPAEVEEQPPPPKAAELLPPRTTERGRWNWRTALIIGAVAVGVVGLVLIFKQISTDHVAVEQQAKEQQVKEQQAKEQQAKEQQAKEQQVKEQQVKEQQVKEQQVKEQQVKEQRVKEQRAKEFALSLQTRWSRPNAEALAGLDAIYADEVVYDGKMTKKDAVIKDKREFAQHWPEREYKPKEPISVSCINNICTVVGLVDFRAVNPVAKTTSKGVATFEYKLIFSGAAVKISLEGGNVLSRTRTPLSDASKPPSSKSPIDNYTVQQNRDIYGQDILLSGGLKSIHGLDLNECAAQCDRNESCVAFSLDHWNLQCYLKSNIGTSRLDPHSTIGVKKPFKMPGMSNAPIQMIASQRTRNHRFRGQPQTSVRVTNFDACKAVCKDDGSCIAFSILKNVGNAINCEIFYFSQEGYFDDNSADSGYKSQ